MPVLLSILIPAFEYPEGIQNILSRIPARYLEDGLLEVIIRDDSRSDQVKEMVSNSGIKCSNLKFFKNQFPNGAVNNWNALFDLASAEYVVLMHHDEFPSGQDYFETLFQILQGVNPPDVVVTNCILVDDQLNAVREHVPSLIKSFVITKSPGYIFRRNIIGPCSTVVFKRSLKVKFDENLKWLVDVDFYYRLRKMTSRWIVVKEIIVCSVSKRQGSITSSVKDSLKSIKSDELFYLNSKYQNSIGWLKNRCFTETIESCVWAFMRFIQLAQGSMFAFKHKFSK